MCRKNDKSDRMAAKTVAEASLGNAALSEAEVLRQINNLKDYAQTHKDEIPGRIYSAMDGISRTALAYLVGKGGHAPKGWAIGAVDAAGEAIWTPEQAALLEEAAPMAIAAQAGGALNPLKFGASSKLVVPGGEMPPISIDAAFQSIKDYLAMIDEKNREIASTIGPVAIVNNLKRDPAIGPVPPYFPIRVQIPSGAILPLINTWLESIRLLVSNPFVDIFFLRSIYSIVLASFDIMRGNWRDGVLSLMGVWGYFPMIIGMVLKTARFVYSWISPDIQERLEDDVFAASKSMFIGGWLWLLSVVSPDFVRTTIQKMIDTAKMPLEKLNEKIDGIEKQTQEVAEKAGVQVIFPRIPLDKIPSFDDIQNFQSLLSNPEIYCSPAFQSALAPAMSVPPLRLFLEMLNVPTLPEKIQERCKDMPQDIAESITVALKPIVIPLPSADSEKKEEDENPAKLNTNTKEPTKEPAKGGSRKTRKRSRSRKSTSLPRP